MNYNLTAGDKLALALPNNTEKIVSMLAAAKVGIIVVPMAPNPSKEELKKVLDLGVKGLIFTDQVGNTDYREIVMSLVPEVEKFQYAKMEGVPFRSEAFPQLRLLANTGQTRVLGMTRFAWMRTDDFGPDLRRHAAKHVTPSSPFMFDLHTNQLYSHDQVLTTARAALGNDVPSNAVVLVTSHLNSPSAFAAGSIAGLVNGSMSLYSQFGKRETLELLLTNDHPQYVVGDSDSFSSLATTQLTDLSVPTAVAVKGCDKQAVSKAQEALKFKNIISL
jgi:hypothetical protein